MDSTKRFDADIDIDVVDIDRNVYGIRAINYDVANERVTLHASGVYVNDGMPHDEEGNATIPYDAAEQYGFHKIDLLSNNAYKEFESKQELLDMMHRPVEDWSVFQNAAFVKELPQVSNSIHLLRRVKPQCVEDLADVLALIRPGKFELVDAYIKDKEAVRKYLYSAPTDSNANYFKRSHAFAYAFMLIAIVNKAATFSV